MYALFWPVSAPAPPCQSSVFTHISFMVPQRARCLVKFFLELVFDGLASIVSNSNFSIFISCINLLNGSIFLPFLLGLWTFFDLFLIFRCLCFFFVSSTSLLGVGGVSLLFPMLDSFEPRLLVSCWVASFVFRTQYRSAKPTLAP